MLPPVCLRRRSQARPGTGGHRHHPSRPPGPTTRSHPVAVAVVVSACSGRVPGQVVPTVLRDGDHCPRPGVMVAGDEASAVSLLPHREPRARRSPRLHHLRVGRGPDHPLEQVESDSTASDVGSSVNSPRHGVGASSQDLVLLGEEVGDREWSMNLDSSGRNIRGRRCALGSEGGLPGASPRCRTRARRRHRSARAHPDPRRWHRSGEPRSCAPARTWRTPAPERTTQRADRAPRASTDGTRPRRRRAAGGGRTRA